MKLMSSEEKHFHVCEMNLRSKSCQVKILLCENMEVNKECHSPITFGICDSFECKLLKKLDDYQTLLEEANNDRAKQKQINTHFRNLLLQPTDIKDRIEKGTLDYAGIDSIIRQQRETYETCGVDTILFLIRMKQRMLEDYLLWCNEKIGKISIDTEVARRQKKENEKALQAEKERKAKEDKDRVTTKPKTEYEKAVARYVKLFAATMPEKEAISKAEQIVQSLGMKP